MALPAPAVPEATKRVAPALWLCCAVPAADLGLAGEDGGDGRGRFRVWGQPGWEGAAFLGVVVAEDAADVGVVFCVAVGVGGEEGALEVGDAGGGGREDVGVPGCHDGGRGGEVDTEAAALSAEMAGVCELLWWCVGMKV